MFSRVLAIWSLLFLEVSSALDPSYFNFEEPDYLYSLYREIMDIFTENPNAANSKAIGLVSDNLDEFSLPIKRLHEDGNAVVLDQDERILVQSSFVEINCGDSGSGDKLDDILLRVIASHTIVVILKNSKNLYFHEIEACMLEVFEKFWAQLTTNIVIMFSSDYKMLVESFPSALKTFAYVYEPYNEEHLRNVTGLSFFKIFYDKTANLHLHPLKVLARERHRFFFEIEDGISQLAGMDGSLAKILGQIFNATIILTYRSIESEVRSGNKNLHERLEQLRNGSVDIWMNVRIIYPKVYEGFAYSYPRERMDIICILPKYNDGRIKYRGMVGGRVLSLLLMMVTVFSILSFMIFFSKKILLQNMPLLKLAKVVLNQSDVITQRTSSTTMRILFGSWLAGSLVYSTSLQTLITARIIRPSVENRMMTIQEVIESDIHLRIEQTYWAITKNHYDDKILKALYENIDVVPDDDLFEAQAPDVGYLATRDVMAFVNTRTSAYVLQEIFLPNLVAYLFPEKSPFISRFNKALTAVTEAGITQKWVADNHHRLKIDSKIVNTLTPAKYITYRHLKSVIYAYSIGMLIAVVVFICEIKFR